MTIPYTFAGQTGIIPLAELDSNFSYLVNSVAVNVVNYGADPTGVADSTVAIQSALTASKLVSFGDAGDTYKISGTLTVQTGSTLIFNGATVTQTALQTPMFDVRNTLGVTISGGNLVGALMTTATAGAFVIGRKYTILTVGTTSFTSIGASANTIGIAFTATGVGSGTGTVSTFFNSAASLDMGIRGDSTTSNLSVYNNTFTRFAYSPLYVTTAGTNIQFIDNIVTGPGASVLSPASNGFRNCTGVTIIGNGVTIRGNTIQDTAQGIIVGQQSTDVVIDENIIKNTLVEHGMYCDTGIQRLTISNNLIHNTCGMGMKVQWYNDPVLTQVPSDITIVGNVIYNTGTEPTISGDGILVYNSAPATMGTLSGVTVASPAVFTTVAAHGLVVGDIISINGVVGMVNAASAVANTLNDTFVVATTPLTTTFTVTNYTNSALSTVGWSAWTSGGTITKALYGNNVTITGNSVRTIGQDGISLRYVKNAVVSGNVVDTCGRTGLYGLSVANVDYSNNNVSNTQYNGAAVYAPLTPCSIRSNTFVNLGLAAVPANGGNSGILLDSNGGGVISYNTVTGESTQTKMLYGIQVGSGDKRNYAVDKNIISNASSAGIALWNDTPNVYPLLSLFNNISTSATGPNTYTGITYAVLGRGTSQRDFFGDAAPVSGTWIQGDKVWAQFPVLNGPIGWVNLVGGTPGTWVPFGNASTAGSGVFTQVTASQNMLVGVTTSAFAHGVQMYGSAANGSANAIQWQYSANSTAATLLLVKSRGTTATAVDLVSNGDDVGSIAFCPTNGVTVCITGLVYAKIAGATSATSMPTSLGFSTTPTGAINASTRMLIDPDGTLNVYANVKVNQLSAIPAGGSTTQALNFSSTANFGIFYGSGVPSASLYAAQGSLYLRTDGSSTSTRMYINTNGVTSGTATWTAVTTVA